MDLEKQAGAQIDDSLLIGLASLIQALGLVALFWVLQQTKGSVDLVLPLSALPPLLIGITLFMLSVGLVPLSHLLIYSALVSVLLGLCGFYVGSQLLPRGQAAVHEFIMALTLAVAGLKLLIYVQSWASEGRISYHALFVFSWRNVLIVAFSVALSLLFYGLLFLFGLLFQVTGIDVIVDALKEWQVLVLLLTMMNAFGIITFRQQSSVIDTASSLQQSMSRVLLVMVAVFALVFLFMLPFTGLTLLWNGGGSTLILAVQGVTLFFLNAVYKDTPDVRPYPISLHRLVLVAVAVMPVYSAISAYGLYLRVDQYGWTLSRCWAVLLWAVFAVFSAGYLVSILKLRDDWLHQVSRINVYMGVVVLVLMLATNSPVLDFRKISVESQMHRLMSGEVKPARFDMRYLARSLGKPGHEALVSLQSRESPLNRRQILQIDALLNPGATPEKFSYQELMSVIQFLGEVSEPAKRAIYGFAQSSIKGVGELEMYSIAAFPLQMDGSGGQEVLLVTERHDSSHRLSTIHLFYQEDSAWHRKQLIQTFRADVVESIKKAVEQGAIGTEPPRWKLLRLGELEFQVDEGEQRRW